MNDAVAAPEFPAGLAWLNLRDPLRMARLRGRVCALALVNLGSGWCQQRLADLGHLRARHRDRLQVVVVHVPRFDAERDAKRSAHRVDLQQYDFPVAHDGDWTAWQHFGLDAWPTVLLIDGDGQVRERVIGESGIRDLDARIGTLLEGLTPQPLAGDPIRLRRDSEPALPLRFPAGLAVSGDLLYIADCGHHRVLECDARGRILRQFGSGRAGFIDGPMALSALTRPHGLCLVRGALYVADTGNHAVRRIDLRSGEVSTVCGAGRPGRTAVGSLADPRAIALSGDRLYVATAGDNRIGQLDLGQTRVAPLCDSGALGTRDGVGAEAAFAEPVALACVQYTPDVCDAAGSAIRSVHLPTGQVTTLVGGGPWQFGAVGGARDDTQLQAPQALALDPEAPVLWTADSGNDTLRQLRLGGGALSTAALPQRLHGSAALAIANGRLWNADTDAHAVLRLDPSTGALRQVAVGE
ncbi:hypothetical protein MNO14_06440 [Luteimonas sp. S4-F44]|uniref:hypothetical protein n=1 Tax=Luteimonas sp. S4-F44 TaxID=2925842 RepID=UPI001F53BA42|nr:hypothetical protein [Luteimonas sp. S4-F44]UNK43702.1 hypothetical protein MNO14_06440 [Luteimonas sp. S4-F44]